MKRETQSRGFSLVEVVVVIAMVGLIASISLAVVTQIHSSAKEEKLVSDTGTLNRAVAAYLASGGSLDKATTPEDVLIRLKSAASAEMRRRMPGFSSSMIDPRITIQEQSTTEAASKDPRVYWNTTAQRFVVAHSGAVGVKEFLLDETLAEVAPDPDVRDPAMLYAKESNWVWDYQNRSNPDAADGPTVVEVADDPVTPPTPAGVPSPGGPPGPSPPASGTLDPPAFSIPGGTYAINLYDMPLSLTDPNPTSTSKIIYAIDFGNWQNYSGSLSVSPGSVVSAQSVALISGWSNSGKIDQAFDAAPAKLAPPIISPDRDSFGLFYEYNINVTLIDTNKPGTSTTRYRINGGAWQDYTNSFLLRRQHYPAGATVEAQSISAGSSYYLDSTVATRSLTSESLNLTGNTDGEFHDPTGGTNMLTNLPPGNSSSYFEWGDGNVSGGSESWMNFGGGAFTDVAEGERFGIGSLTYYNGSIRSGTGAETIDLDIGLELDINGNLFNPYFDFTFELINTVNNGDAWASSDYVRLMDPRASRTLVINDNEFEFRLEFGETTAAGFSLFDEFHVQENKDASVNLYGTFVSLGPVSTTSLDGSSKVSESVDASLTGTGSPSDPTAAPLYQMNGYVDGEEAASNLIAELTPYETIAEAAANDAKAEADKAEANEAETLAEMADAEPDDDDDGDGVTATAAAQAAEAAAQAAEAVRQLAEDAAIKAKTGASEANTIASSDPSAVDEAQAAIDSAVRAIDFFDQASADATRARTAADNAAAAIGGGGPIFGTGAP